MNNSVSNASTACDAWITAPLTKSCGVGDCSNATGTPTCVCAPGWSGVGDFDFRSLPVQDADCDKYPALFRAVYLVGAIVSFVNIWLCGYMWFRARHKNDRKRSLAILACAVSIYGTVLWGFHGIDPGRSIGVDPVLTAMFAGYISILYILFTYTVTTSESSCL